MKACYILIAILAISSPLSTPQHAQADIQPAVTIRISKGVVIAALKYCKRIPQCRKAMESASKATKPAGKHLRRKAEIIYDTLQVFVDGGVCEFNNSLENRRVLRKKIWRIEDLHAIELPKKR